MGDPTAKKRLGRAKKSVEEILIKTGYKIIPSDNSQFCILGVRKKEIRMIKVVIGRITDGDVKTVKELDLPGICTKEIWCRDPRKKDFEIREIR